LFTFVRVQIPSEVVRKETYTRQEAKTRRQMP
jgi:hypothetical protein